MPFLVFPVFALLVEVQDAKTIKKFKGYDDKKTKLTEFSILPYAQKRKIRNLVKFSFTLKLACMRKS